MRKGQIAWKQVIGATIMILVVITIIFFAIKIPTSAKKIINMTNNARPKFLSDTCEDKSLPISDQIKGCYDIGNYALAVEKAEEVIKKNPNDETIDAAKLHNFVAWSYIEMDTDKYGSKIMLNALRAKEIAYKLNKVDGDEGGVEYKRALEAILEYSYREFKKIAPAQKINKPRDDFISYFPFYSELFPKVTEKGAPTFGKRVTPYDEKKAEISEDAAKSRNA